jgi:hypothetical protein
MIASGFSYSQIVDGHPDITYMDIFRAAAEALQLATEPSDYEQRLARIKDENPRAYERWSDEEDEALKALWEQGMATSQIAWRLERQPSAIASRLRKLGLNNADQPATR